MISPAQCRAARTLLAWPMARLATAAGVSERAVDEFELEQSDDPATAAAVERAFAGVGMQFLPGDDVRFGAVTP